MSLLVLVLLTKVTIVLSLAAAILDAMRAVLNVQLRSTVTGSYFTISPAGMLTS